MRNEKKARQRVAGSESKALWSTAYHEAGHAVVGWRLGIGLRKKGVTIVPDEAMGYLGCCAPRRIIARDIEWNDSGRNRMRVEKKVQCLLAGEIARGATIRRACGVTMHHPTGNKWSILLRASPTTKKR
jgi:hypothetical protein